MLSTVLAGGHVLLEDFPGLGKTLAARSFAQTLGLDFRRAQFTPDLLPADLTGSFVYDQRIGDFEFRRGPLFAGLLLADEINRTPPKTQSALLEAMQERQVTVEGQTFALPSPFHVLATANPVEYEGTYPLPEAQLDRFMMRVSFGYPTPDEEWDVLRRRLAAPAGGADARPGDRCRRRCSRCRRPSRSVTVDESISRYCVALAAATRAHQHVLMGASPRGSLALVLTVTRVRRDRRPRLRHAGGREGRRHRGPRASDHREARAVDEQGHPARPSSSRCSPPSPAPSVTARE